MHGVTKEATDQRMVGAIELAGVARRYRVGNATVTALEDVDLEIKPGEFIVVLGPSGAARRRC